MRLNICIIMVLFVSCLPKTYSDDLEAVEAANDFNTKLEKIPPDGTYRYDIAFAEWGGKSMGEKVTIIIKEGAIRVIYEGDGTLAAGKGEILDEGRILKHKSGKWIIAHQEGDVNLDEIGECTDGPRIVDFVNKKFWTC